VRGLSDKDREEMKSVSRSSSSKTRSRIAVALNPAPLAATRRHAQLQKKVSPVKMRKIA